MADQPPVGPSRRAVLAGGAAAVAGGGLLGHVADEVLEDRSRGGAGSSGAGSSGAEAQEGIGTAVGAAAEQFHGARQAGITTAPQAHAVFAAFDLPARVTRAEVQGVLRVWSQDAARLTSGRGGLADLERELAEGPSRLTVTIGLGPGVFDHIRRPELRPSWLRPLPAFPAIDRLEERWSGGDLLLQIRGDDPLVVAHAHRVLSAGVRGAAEHRWAQRGFRRAAGTTAPGVTQRNLFGQVDGTVNPSPDDSDFEQKLFDDGAGQRWMRGGSSVVLRRIRMELDTWEQVDRTSRELAMGRRLDSGAPLTGRVEADNADFAAVDDAGLPVIPPGCHMARAHQRTRDEVFLRVPYSYDDPPAAGRINDAGLLFVAYQADPVRQFVPVQRRLAELDALNTWTTPVGSAVFALPPGAQEGGYVGEGLFEG